MISSYINRVIHGDCLEVMKGMPDKCVDLVLTDPPYWGLRGGTAHKGLGGVAKCRTTTETVGDLWGASHGWIPDAWRIAKYGLISFCSYHSVDDIPKLFPAGSKVCLLTWYKRNSPNPVNNVPKFTSEFAWAFKTAPGLKWSAWTTTVFDIPNITAGCVSTGERITEPSGVSAHPTQKPLKLMMELLAIGGDLILDPFCGSGTTLVAAKMLGRRYIGIDIEKKYCDIAEERLRNTTPPLPFTQERTEQGALGI